MGEVIVVTSGKGGVGKTTATANIGAGFARLGKKVLLIDTDIGLRNLDIVLGFHNRVVYDLLDVKNGVCEPKQAMLSDQAMPNLFLLPAPQTKAKEEFAPEDMIQLCEKFKESFDYIIIDCPAGVEHGFHSAVAGADQAIIVAIPELSSVRDAERVVGLLEKDANIPSERQHLLINRIHMNLVKKGLMLSPEDMLSILGISLIGIVPEEESVLIAAHQGKPVISNTKSRVSSAYQNICRRLMGENVSLLSLNSRGPFFRWFQKD